MASRATAIVKPKPKAKSTTTSKRPSAKSQATATVTKVAKPAAKTTAKPVAKSAVKAPKLLNSVGAVETTATASFEGAAPKPRRRGKAEIRTRIYWAVFSQGLKRVAVFEFDQKEEAEKRAGKLAKTTGEHHFIHKIKAIVQ